MALGKLALVAPFANATAPATLAADCPPTALTTVESCGPATSPLKVPENDPAVVAEPIKSPLNVPAKILPALVAVTEFANILAPTKVLTPLRKATLSESKESASDPPDNSEASRLVKPEPSPLSTPLVPNRKERPSCDT